MERRSNPKYDHQRAANALRRIIRKLWRDKRLRRKYPASLAK